MKKRFLCCVLTLVIALGAVTGCAWTSGSGAASSLGDTVSPYAQKKIGVCLYQFNDNFMTLFCNELVDYLISLGFSKDNIIVYGSSNNQTIQLNQVGELINRGVDALIINPVNSSIVHDITDKAMESNVPVVYINREPSAEEESYWEKYDLNVTYVGCDARQSGIYQGELLLELGKNALDINKDGVVQYYMIQGSPENIDATYRTMYSLSSLENADIKLDCLLNEVANWDMGTASLITEKGLKNGPAPEVIIANNDAMALGAIKAVKEAGLTPGKDVYVVGVDALSEALELVIDGEMVGTVFNDHIAQSHSAANAVINYLNGIPNEHYIGCEYVKVDASNANDVLSLVEASNSDDNQ